MGGTGGILEVADVQIGRSIGAKSKNYNILLPNGEYTQLTEGTRITNIEVMAGDGRIRKIDKIDHIVANYGGNPDKWQYMKGIGYVDYVGESFKAELHWHQEPTVGKHIWKLKPDIGGNWFID